MNFVQLPSGMIVNLEKVINLSLPMSGKGWLRLSEEPNKIDLTEDDVKKVREALARNRVHLK